MREVRGYEGGPQEASLKVRNGGAREPRWLPMTDDLERRGEEGRRERGREGGGGGGGGGGEREREERRGEIKQIRSTGMVNLM